MTTVKYVLVEQHPPRRLHRTDCWHPPHGAEYRLATQAELRTLRECYHCARKDR